MSIGISAAALCGNLFGMGLMVRYSRRSLWLTGLVTATIVMLCIGVLGAVSRAFDDLSIIWAQAGLMLVWNLVFGAMISPAAIAIMSEVASSQLRSKTIAVASATQFSGTIVVTIILPFMINPEQGNLAGKSGLVFAAVSFLYAIWGFFNVPDTNRHVEELDELFESNINARAFEDSQIHCRFE